MAHRERERRVDRTDREEPRREAPRQSKPLPLNDYWIDGEGINREVLQIEICKYLGAEATCRPGDYNGRRGYRIKALRPFTPQMLEDLKETSENYISENRGARAHGYEETSYIGSQTRQRRDNNGYAPPESRFPQSSETNGGGYSSYSGSSGYPASSGYPIESGYPAGGYSIAGQTASYPAMAEGTRYNPNYAPYPQNGAIDYPPSSYGYVPGPMYGEPGQPPRGEPRIPPGYMYQSSPPDIQGRAAPVDNRYRGPDFYETPIPQPSMGGRGEMYGAPQRGQPSPYSGIPADYQPDRVDYSGGRHGRR